MRNDGEPLQRLGRMMLSNLGGLALLVALVAVAVVALVSGGSMFSPGPLNAQSHKGHMVGGVSSHAAIDGNCAACHAPPWSRDNMASRCLQCHTDVRDELDDQQPFHGRLTQGRQCRSCHTEHNGPQADITSFASFDHDCTRFQLTGKHSTVACKSCHRDNQYQDTPRDCAGCHSEPPAPDVHKFRYGTSCGQCHSTTAFAGASFKHTFPLNHGRGRRGATDCATCHKVAEDFTTYTCYGCHEHSQERTERKHARLKPAELQNCVHCHKNGREHDHERERGLAPGFDRDQLCLAAGIHLCTRSTVRLFELGDHSLADGLPKLDPESDSVPCVPLVRRSRGTNPLDVTRLPSKH